jgi:hypothetical protein
MSDEQKDKASLGAVQDFYKKVFFKNNDKNHKPNGHLNKLAAMFCMKYDGQVLDPGASEWLLALWPLQWQFSPLFYSQECLTGE